MYLRSLVFCPKTINARKGVKTISPVIPHPHHVVSPKTINARKGVKTLNFANYHFTRSRVQKPSMPVRALRLW